MANKSAAGAKSTTAADTEEARRLGRRRRAVEFLKLASDPWRLGAILLLGAGERPVGVLAEELGQSRPALAHHLALLRHGRVITSSRRGKNVVYSLTDAGEALARLVERLIG